jgi:hypothetical protein
MSICNIFDLGCFDKCDEVVINLITTETIVVNTRTGLSFTFSIPNLGLLNPGVYCFSRSGQRYQFIVKDSADCSTYEPALPPEGVYLDIAAYRFGDQLQEAGVPGTVPRTFVDAIGQPAGLMYDRGSSVLAMRSSTNRPTIEAFGDIDAAWDFTGASKSGITYSYLPLSLNPFSFLHGIDNSYSLRATCGFPVGSNGNNITILTTNGVGNSTTIGFTLRKSSANAIQVIAQRGTSGVSKYFYTHTEPILDNDVARIVLNINGTGVGAGSLTVNGVTETFDVTTGVDSLPSPNNGIIIGGALLASPDDILIQDVKITSDLMTTQEISDYMAARPEVSLDPFPPVSKLRFNALDTDFVLNSGGSPANDGEEVAQLRNQIPNLLDATAWRFQNPTGGERPSFQEAIQNGENALQYDGSNDELVNDQSLIPEKGGVYALFVCQFNQDSADGSHVMSGEDYIAITGEDYVGAFSVPYGVAHFDTQVPTVVGTDINNNVEAYCLKRVGESLTMFNANGERDDQSDNIPFDLDNMGRPSGGGGFVNWWMDGLVFHVERIVGIVSDEDCIAYTKQLRDKYLTP